MEILNRNRIGIIFRAFAQKESQLEERVALVNEAITKALNICHEGKPVFHSVDILVPSNPNFPSVDCGKMVEQLKTLWRLTKRVHIHKSPGDLFCGTLNFGIAAQTQRDVRYSFIVSPDAHSYLTEGNVMAMIDKANNGARVVGLAIHELADSIRKGRVANTFCLWNNASLITAGGFNLLSAELEGDKRSHYLEGIDEEGNKVFYKINGVEEIIPAALMVRTFGPCIAVVDPPEDMGRYEVVSDPEIKKRHEAKMATKNARQNELLSLIGLHPSFLENGGLIK